MGTVHQKSSPAVDGCGSAMRPLGGSARNKIQKIGTLEIVHGSVRKYRIDGCVALLLHLPVVAGINIFKICIGLLLEYS